MKSDKKYYDLVDRYNETEGDRVHHAMRADKYRDLLKEALKKLDEYSQKSYNEEVKSFEKEVEEWFEAFEYKA